jgi:hypothetical protein
MSDEVKSNNYYFNKCIQRSCFNPQSGINIDKLAFDELLEEASKLYSSINVRDSISNQEFLIAGVIKIFLRGGKRKILM